MQKELLCPEAGRLKSSKCLRMESPLCFQKTRRMAGKITLLAAAALMLGSAELSAQVIRCISAPGKFYVDDKAGIGIVYNYAAYTISNNTASTLPSVYVAITNIVSTNRINLVSVDSGVRALGSLTPGQTKMAAFFLKG